MSQGYGSCSSSSYGSCSPSFQPFVEISDPEPMYVRTGIEEIVHTEVVEPISCVAPDYSISNIINESLVNYNQVDSSPQDYSFSTEIEDLIDTEVVEPISSIDSDYSISNIINESLVNYNQVDSSSRNYFNSTVFNKVLEHNSFNQLGNSYSKEYNSLEHYHHFSMRMNYHFIPDNFLKPGKFGMFVGDAKKIKCYIEEAFKIMFDYNFPDDIKVSVLNEEKFRKLAPNNSTIGISINRRKEGFISEIFILNDQLARVMLTVGHELGHVLTETLNNAQDEEAKAFAFSLAWMKVIKENNIAGLGDSIIDECPAENGLHDVSFSYVKKKLNNFSAWDLYLMLINRKCCVAG